MTKLLFDDSPETNGHGKILGGCMVGTHAGDMIGEIALAIEMGADAVDIGKTISSPRWARASAWRGRWRMDSRLFRVPRPGHLGLQLLHLLPRQQSPIRLFLTSAVAGNIVDLHI